jgi:hypothetical protein
MPTKLVVIAAKAELRRVWSRAVWEAVPYFPLLGVRCSTILIRAPDLDSAGAEKFFVSVPG